MSEYADELEVLTSVALHIVCDLGFLLNPIVELEDEVVVFCSL